MTIVVLLLLADATHYSRGHGTEGEIQVYLANTGDLFQLHKKLKYGTALEQSHNSAVRKTDSCTI